MSTPFLHHPQPVSEHPPVHVRPDNPYGPFRPEQPPAGQPPTAQPPTVQPTSRDARRPGWFALAGTATAAALAASLGTAGLTGAFDTEVTPPAPAQEQANASSVLPTATAEPDWQALAAVVRPSVVAIDVRTASGAGQGSGVIIDAGGHILTNDHVVGDAAPGGLRVTLSDGRVLEATVVGTDPTTDLAVIRLVDPPADLQPASLGDSEDVAVGAAVMAVGNPLGLDSTVTTGIVSAVDRPVSTSRGPQEQVVTNAIQIDAAVNPGNSGGPLFDAAGEVIGINSSIAALSGGASGSIGLGFAIPSNLAHRVAADLIKDGSADHAFLGVSLSDGVATFEDPTAGSVSRHGAVIEQVSDGSPAAEAGLRAGDVVVAIDDDRVGGAESLTGFVRERPAGADATLTVVRDGEAVEVEVTLAVLR